MESSRRQVQFVSSSVQLAAPAPFVEGAAASPLLWASISLSPSLSLSLLHERVGLYNCLALQDCLGCALLVSF